MKWWLLFIAFISVGYVCFGALSKTYPISATTQIRIDAYMDAITTIYNSTYTVHYSTHDYDSSSLYLINEILDQDIEQYLVYPSTSCPLGWKGWGMQIINGNNVPIVCN